MIRVLFLQPLWFEFEGVMALSAELKKAGHWADVVVGKPKELVEEVQKYDPDIIAFPLTTARRAFMMETSKLIRKAGIKTMIIAGGHDTTFFPELINYEHLDIICIGEGDDAIVELADAIEKGKDYTKIKNLWVKINGKVYKNDIRPFKDPNIKPMEDREIYRKYPFFKDIEFAQVMVGRGCPNKCSYCFNHKYAEMYAKHKQSYCALRKVDILIKELLILKNKYKYKNIFFNDSTLMWNKKWLLEFLKKYKEKIDLPFSINMCVNEIDEDIAKAIADTKKCYIVRFGLEHGNEMFRLKVLRKPCTDENYIKATNLLKKYKIRYSMAFMMGLPGETLQNAFESLDFAVKISDKNSVRAVNIFKPFPRLDITEYGIKIGQYDPKKIGSNLIGEHDMNFYDCFRTDDVGRQILMLSRFSHFYMNFPRLRPLIKRLIKLPDNPFYRLVWKFSDGYWTARHHTNASRGYLFKYIFKYFMRPVI